MKESAKVKPWKIVVFSLTFFILSLTQSAFTYQDFDGKIDRSSSLLLFLGGSIAILGGGLLEWIIWLANPFYLISIFLLLNKKRSAIKFSSIATVLALSFSLWSRVLISEDGREAQIISKNLGYWLWTISILIITIGIRYYFKEEKSNSIGN